MVIPAVVSDFAILAAVEPAPAAIGRGGSIRVKDTGLDSRLRGNDGEESQNGGEIEPRVAERGDGISNDYWDHPPQPSYPQSQPYRHTRGCWRVSIFKKNGDLDSRLRGNDRKWRGNDQEVG